MLQHGITWAEQQETLGTNADNQYGVNLYPFPRINQEAEFQL